MNTNPQYSRQTQPANHNADIQQDFAQAQTPELVVEHRTIVGFLRLTPRRFHLDEIIKFGNQVGRVAESLQLAYMTTTDSQLGILRVFPVPLMRRVYDIMADQFKWQPWVEPQELPEDTAAARDAVRSNERLASMLRAFMEAAESEEIQDATSVVLERVENDLEGLRAQLTALEQRQTPPSEGGAPTVNPQP